MRHRIVFAIAGALFMMVLEILALPLLWAVRELRYTLYAPALLGGDFLVFARDELDWPIPAPEGMSELPCWFDMYLLYFNWFCYAALGFGIGWWMGRVWCRRLSARTR